MARVPVAQMRNNEPVTTQAWLQAIGFIEELEISTAKFAGSLVVINLPSFHITKTYSMELSLHLNLAKYFILQLSTYKRFLILY